MPRRGQQPALIHWTVDRCLSRRRYPGVRYGSTRGLAASGKRVGCHQELRGNKKEKKQKYMFVMSGHSFTKLILKLV